MTIQEKISKIESIVIQQKKILSELNITNFVEYAIKIRILENQKNIIIATPSIKKPA